MAYKLNDEGQFAPDTSNALYDPGQFMFKSDGTVYNAQTGQSEAAVVVPDPTGELGPLSGLSGQGWAVVPQSVAAANNLTVTSQAQPDPDFNQGSGLGDVLKIVAPLALSYFGVPYLAEALGGNVIAAKSIIGAGSSLLTGGDPLTGAITGAAIGALGASEPAGFSSFDNADATGPGASGVPATAAGGDIVNAADVSGTPTAGQEFLKVAAAPSATMTDVPVGSGDAANIAVTNAYGSGYSLAADDAAAGASASTALTGAGSSNGILGDIWQWAKDHPGPAATIAGTAMGAIGGIGKGALEYSAVEKKIAADKALLSQKTQEQLALEAGKRAAIKSGSYFDAAVPVKPSGQPLRRPDGSLVYQNGIIARATR